MTKDLELPEPPAYTAADFEGCEKPSDYLEVFFDWYRHIAVLCTLTAAILAESGAAKPVSPLTSAVLVGLLNRCARLMLANVALSHEGKFGEALSILDRCIKESATKVQWICQEDTDDRAKRFVADGLGAEIEFKTLLEQAVANRSGIRLPIEDRMLRSIDDYFRKGMTSVSEVQSTKKMPNFEQLFSALGQTRMDYVIHQRLGSHHIHGTWPSLLHHYLEEDPNGILQMWSEPLAPHITQFVAVALSVSEAIQSYAKVRLRPSDADEWSQMVRTRTEAMFDLYKLAVQRIDSNRMPST